MTLTAKQAAKTAQATLQAEARAKAKERAAETKAARENNRYIRTTLIPQRFEEIQKQIAEVASHGRHEIEHIEVTGPLEYDGLTKRLRRRGFTVSQLQSHDHEGRYHDYGDFNAPCNVWEDGYREYWFSVSWLNASK